MREAGDAVSGQAIHTHKRWLCVAAALFSLVLLLPSLPVARANLAELVTTDDTAKAQPSPVAFVTVDEDDDDGMPTSTPGALVAAVAPAEAYELEWISPVAAQPFCAPLGPAPTVRAPPVVERA